MPYNAITRSLEIPSYLQPHVCTLYDLVYDPETRHESGAVVKSFKTTLRKVGIACSALGVSESPEESANQEGQDTSMTFVFYGDHRIVQGSGILFRGEFFHVDSVKNPDNMNVMFEIQATRRDINAKRLAALNKEILDIAPSPIKQYT